MDPKKAPPCGNGFRDLHHGRLQTMSLEPERCRLTPGFPAAPEKNQAKRQMIAM